MAGQSARVRIAINGYGVIGKRVADAVSCQDDMELVGTSVGSLLDGMARRVPSQP